MNTDLNTQHAEDKLDPLIADVHTLVNGLVWNTEQPRYLAGQQSRILLQSRAAPETGRCAALITVTSVVGATQSLDGRLIIILNREASQREAPQREGLTCFGYLNRLGQVLFSSLEHGTYRVTVQPALARRSGQTPLLLSLVPLPRLELAAAASTQERWQHIYRNASGSLTATLWKREQNEVEIDFDTRERSWDGTIVGFRWSPAADLAPQLLLAPLVWSERMQSCVAQVSLGPASALHHPELTEQPVAPAALADTPLAVIRESVVRAARAQTRRAWQRLIQTQGASLPAETRAVIEEALAAFEGTF
jgi:hypothetical protein